VTICVIVWVMPATTFVDVGDEGSVVHSAMTDIG
jgi:hypothetical protein